MQIAITHGHRQTDRHNPQFTNALKTVRLATVQHWLPEISDSLCFLIILCSEQSLSHSLFLWPSPILIWHNPDLKIGLDIFSHISHIIINPPSYVSRTGLTEKQLH